MYRVSISTLIVLFVWPTIALAEQYQGAGVKEQFSTFGPPAWQTGFWEALHPVGESPVSPQSDPHGEDPLTSVDHGHDHSTEGESGEHGHGDHGDEHDDHEQFDVFKPVHHRHETKDGFPIFEAIKTDHAFIERKVRLDFQATAHADNGAANESQFSGEFFWAFNNRIAAVVSAPIVFRNPIVGSSTGGLGDTEIGFRFVAFNGECSILTFGLNVSTPTGNADRGLGQGFTSLEPVALLWHDLGGGTVLQTEVGLESPVGFHENEVALNYNFALLHTLRSTEHLFFFHWLTPLIELNCLTDCNGDSLGRTIINLTPGFRWEITEEDVAGFGYSFPITGTRDFDSQFTFSFIHHF